MILGRIGAGAIARRRSTIQITAVAGSAVFQALRVRTWTRPTRNVLARQILFTGLEAVPFITFIAVMVGISVVVQAQLWLGKVGQTSLLGPLLVAVIVRELGPLLTNFVVIGRSGAAMAAEMGNIQVRGEGRVLEAQGIDPFLYLVVPRVIGCMIAVFCLTMFFILGAFVVGFLLGQVLGVNNAALVPFVNNVMEALAPRDVWNLLAKTLIPGLLTGAICCFEGYHIRGAVTEVPQATTRSMVRSVAALFITSAAISLMTYL